MNTIAEDSFGYCADMVRRRDEDRWLAAQYAPADRRAALLALYALHLEIEAAPGKVTEPAIGEMRLQWWREAIAEARSPAPVRAHPVLKAVDQANFIDEKLQSDFDAAIEARARLLYGEPFERVDEVARWIAAAEGYLAPAAARMLSSGDARFDDPLREAATAYALARRGATLAPSLANDTTGHARQLHARAAKALSDLPPASAPAALHFTLTPAYLEGAPSALGRRWRLFKSMATGRV